MQPPHPSLLRPPGTRARWSPRPGPAEPPDLGSLPALPCNAHRFRETWGGAGRAHRWAPEGVGAADVQSHQGAAGFCGEPCVNRRNRKYPSLGSILDNGAKGCAPRTALAFLPGARYQRPSEAAGERELARFPRSPRAASRLLSILGQNQAGALAFEQELSKGRKSGRAHRRWACRRPASLDVPLPARAAACLRVGSFDSESGHRTDLGSKPG